MKFLFFTVKMCADKMESRYIWYYKPYQYLPWNDKLKKKIISFAAVTRIKDYKKRWNHRVSDLSTEHPPPPLFAKKHIIIKPFFFLDHYYHGRDTLHAQVLHDKSSEKWIRTRTATFNKKTSANFPLLCRSVIDQWPHLLIVIVRISVIKTALKHWEFTWFRLSAYQSPIISSSPTES